MRRVMVSMYKQREDMKFDIVEKGEALFHQFGVDHAEYESGPGNFSTALVEYSDGTVGNVPVEMIRFIHPAQGHLEWDDLDSYGPSA